MLYVSRYEHALGTELTRLCREDGVKISLRYLYARSNASYAYAITYWRKGVCVKVKLHAYRCADISVTHAVHLLCHVAVYGGLSHRDFMNGGTGERSGHPWRLARAAYRAAKKLFGDHYDHYRRAAHA